VGIEKEFELAAAGGAAVAGAGEAAEVVDGLDGTQRKRLPDFFFRDLKAAAHEAGRAAIASFGGAGLHDSIRGRQVGAGRPQRGVLLLRLCLSF
jgi:hypothetical protein